MKENIKKARQIRNMSPIEKYRNFIELVRTNGKWDYKQQNPEFQDFGNFHYGVVGITAGFSEGELLRAAGVVQQFGENRNYGEGIMGIKSPYGDDPRDQEQIRKGIEWYKRNKGYFE